MLSNNTKLGADSSKSQYVLVSKITISDATTITVIYMPSNSISCKVSDKIINLK